MCFDLCVTLSGALSVALCLFLLLVLSVSYGCFQAGYENRGCPRYILEKAKIGDLVSMPIKVSRIAVKCTSAAEPYLVLVGYERSGIEVGPLRIWGHGEDDLGGYGFKIVMLRGMKVAYGSTWNEVEQKYIKDRARGPCLEACSFTAIEDVSQNRYICKLF